MSYWNQTIFLKISLDTQWSCLLKTKLLAFLKTSNEAAYRKYPMHDPSDHATHRQFLIFILAVNCQAEARKDAYVKMKLGSRGSAWSTNMDVVSLLNSSNATTVTWCESFLQAVFPHFLFFLFFFFCNYVSHELVLLRYITIKQLLSCAQHLTIACQPRNHWRHICNWLRRGLKLI